MEENKQNEKNKAGAASAAEVRAALESMRKKLFTEEGWKPSVAEFVRLFELLQELENRDIEEVRGRWVESSTER